MSFGFGVGDFVAVGTLVVKIVDSLRGIQSEYQELIRELENLQRALSQVDKLKGRGDQAIAVDRIKSFALTCRYQLEDFLVKIQKYEKSLGLGKSVTKIRDAGRKVQYAFGKKDEATTLRSYLNIHIGTINMLMVLQGLEMLDVASEQTDKNNEELMERIEGSSKELREVKGNVKAQSLAVRENNSIIQKLFWMVSGEIAAPLRSLSQTVTKVCVTTQQIHSIVLELKSSVWGIDTRFTYFQAPVRVEDALGRVFPFSSECSIEALDAEIRARFKEGPGKTKVLAGDFEIFNAKSTDQAITISGHNILVPGMSINMAIVLKTEFAEGDKCPMPHCVSTTFIEAVGGGRTCSECHVWLDKASKKRKRDSEGEISSKDVKTWADRNRDEARRRKTYEQIAEIGHSDSEETSIGAFKRIRFDRWANDRRKGQEELYEATKAYQRQRMDGVRFDGAPLMMANGRDPPRNLEHQWALIDAFNPGNLSGSQRHTEDDSALNAIDLLTKNGINPHNLSDSQFASFQQQDTTVQQKSIHVYAHNLAKRQREISSAGEMSGWDSPLIYPPLEPSVGIPKFYGDANPVAGSSSEAGVNHTLPDNPREKSPAPECLPRPESSPSPERLIRSSKSVIEDEEHHPKAQASQGDAVLIGFMGGLNHPDLATKAGKVPLPQSDESDVEDQPILGGKKRYPKAQASQGDAVLIGFMGGLNHPDLATKAGEVPLPQSDESDVEDQPILGGKKRYPKAQASQGDAVLIGSLGRAK